MAAVWKGAISFGLVSIPVEVRPAVRSDRLSFRMLHAKDLKPVRFERVSSTTGDVVPWREIVKGYEYQKGKFVVLTREDFDEAALDASKTIDILDFVQEDEVDPRFFDTPYYLVPAKGGEKAYALLREAVRKSGAVGIGTIIMHQKQHLVAIEAVGDALLLETMRFPTELVDADAFTFPPASLVRPQELAMAEQLVANLAQPFEPEKYTDAYRANLMRIIKAKLKGRKAKLAGPAEEPADAKVIDLMSRLQASLAGENGPKRAGRAKRRRGAATHARASTRPRSRRRSA